MPAGASVTATFHVNGSRLFPYIVSAKKAANQPPPLLSGRAPLFEPGQSRLANDQSVPTRQPYGAQK